MSASDAPRRGGGGFAGAVASEWTKAITVRSTWACLASAVVLVGLYVVIIGVSLRSPAPGADAPAEVVPSTVAAGGLMIMGQFALITLATLAIAGEYSTGSIRNTLQCVPVRGRMLLAKSAMVMPILFSAGVLLGLAGSLAADAALGTVAAPQSGPERLTAALAMGAYLALTAVLVIGIGAMVRSVAGTLTVGFVLILILPMALQSASVHLLQTVGAYFPGSAGMALMGIAEDQPYPAATGLLVLLGWALLGLLGGMTLLNRRDA
ncbi:ABC transporter [Mangrovihabitans endophyticus]|uniref:ABC transporter permease n=1 Tax=Mangrovihabitans endophyticus TaxID=1751298 RepID=A0A8J3BVU9_9ACTN|nr:ABC transporter [Mangrovihabitans endophyticus]GGK72984.1 ABC transporter permease [Mangrovihabitans endophyticus]